MYRFDYPSLSSVLPIALAETANERTGIGGAVVGCRCGAVGQHRGRVRFNQLCGAATAKSMEDCLFYRDARLVSLNEVGGEPQHFGVSVAEFHQRAAVRARLWPQAMVALSTHDTKRGEDVRARIGVLSQVPSLWAELRQRLGAGAPHLRTGRPDSSCCRTSSASGRPTVSVTDELRDRLHAYAEKVDPRSGASTRPGTTRTQKFESAVHAWIDAVIDGPVATELTGLVARLDEHARSDALGQKLLALTVPGVPDVYQGTELWEDSLVDPDNRRPVDYQARREALRTLNHPKIRVVTAALRLRRERPDSFTDGGYTPVLATGPAAEHRGGVSARRRRAGGGHPAQRAAGRNGLGRHSFGVTRWSMDRPNRQRPIQRRGPGRRPVRRSSGGAVGAHR